MFHPEQKKKVESIHKLRVRWNHLFRGVLGILVGITFMYAPDTQASDTDKTEQKNKIILASENETSQPNDDFLVVRPENQTETDLSETDPLDSVPIEYITAQTTVSEQQPHPEFSERVGEILFLRSIDDHQAFLLRTDDQGQATRITTSQNSLVPGGRIYRVLVMDNNIGEILADNGMYMPFGNGHQRIYVDLDNYSQTYEIEPLSVFPETTNQDKQIVVLRDGVDGTGTPEIVLFEGSRIIMRVPVVAGGYDSTPLGDHRIYMVRGSRHMQTTRVWAGVGFVMYFRGGYAIHASPRGDWNVVGEGAWGSSGCVNVPDEGWHQVEVGNVHIPVSQFIYHWTSTVIGLEPGQEEVRVPWNDPGYTTGESALRVIIVETLGELYNYPNQGSATMQDLYNAILENDGNLLPSFSVSEDS